MITPYVGEFLFNPVPLEIALHRCNFGCVYCFATLNYRHSQYTYHPAKLFRQLSTLRDKDNLTARLLRDGYPVLLSNHTDPFCPANRDLSRSLIETLRAMNVPVAFQTKGGIPDDLLDAQPPSVWYLTITTDNEEVRSRFEPGAPPIADRLRLIQRLTERGHVVTVGMNPYVPEWWTDEVSMLAQLKALGVHGVWTELLHLHYRQRDHLTAHEKAAFSPELIEKSMRRYDPPEWLDAWDRVREEIAQAGMWPYSVGQGKYSEFFTPYASLYTKLFPTYQDFTNVCHLTERDRADFVTEKEFLAFFAPQLPQGRFNEVNSYLGATNHDLFWTHKIPNALTFKELLSILWRNIQTKKSITRCGAFALPVLKDEMGKEVWFLDKDGLPLVSFQQKEVWTNAVDIPSEEAAAWHYLRYPDDAPEPLRGDVQQMRAELLTLRDTVIARLTSV